MCILSAKKTNHIVRLVVVPLLVGGITVAAATANEISIVVPPAFENVEGDTFDGFRSSYRYQEIIPASFFSSLPATHQTIIAVYLRPDESTTPRTVSYDDLLIQYSTTSTAPADLDPVFDNNVGADVMTVFQGPLTVSTQATGPSGGPKDFDYLYPFQPPFVYDHTSGRNLLVDVRAANAPNLIYDAETIDEAMSRAIVGSVFDDSGEDFNKQPIYQFVFIPEPTLPGVALLWLGCAALMRRRH